jgi:phosphoribosylglycinamide formyltransferase-1
MSKTRIGILLSGGGRTMVNIAQQITAGDINGEIVTVVSSRSDVAGIGRSKDLGIMPMVISRKAFDSTVAFSQAIFVQMRDQNVSLVLMCGWLCLCEIPEDFTHKVLNIHPSLLPKYGGKGMYGHHVHEAVIANGETESGTTVHFVNNNYDDGPVIIQRRCAIAQDDTPETLAAKVFTEESIAYPQAINYVIEERILVDNNQVTIKAPTP